MGDLSTGTSALAHNESAAEATAQDRYPVHSGANMKRLTFDTRLWRCRLALMATLAGGASAVNALPAQGVDYADADRIRTFDPLLVGGRVYPVWLSDSIRFYYEANGNGADRGTLYLADPRTRTKHPLIDNVRVAASLSAAADTSIDPHKLPAATLVNGDRALQFDVRGKSYWCPLDASRCAPADSAQLMARRKASGLAWAARSPNGEWDAFVWNYNVYVRPARLTDTDPAAWRARPRAPVRNGCDAPTMPGPLPPRDSVPLPAGSIALTTDGTATAPHRGVTASIDSASRLPASSSIGSRRRPVACAGHPTRRSCWCNAMTFAACGSTE